MRFLLVSVLMSFAITTAAAAVKSNAKAKSSTKNMDFDSQVVEGEVYRPDYSVVTGESPGEGWGILRLRSDFRDHAATDAEENRR